MNYPNWAGHIIYLEKRHQLAVMASVTLLALILFSVQAIALVKLLRSNNVADAVQTANMPERPKPVPKVVASVPLFGNPSMAADEAANKNLPATNLQLVLRGVVADSDAAKSSAMIEEPSKPALSYNVGDTLPGNAVLNAVFTDHVVLKRNGQLETLNFPIQSKLNIKDDNNVHAPDDTKKGSSPSARMPGQNTSISNTSPQSIQERLQQLQQQHEQR
jgi:general secretion pathway protein C